MVRTVIIHSNVLNRLTVNIHGRMVISSLQNINRMTTVESDNGKKYYLRDVIAHSLHYLVSKALASVNSYLVIQNMSRLSAKDIDWVLTVPAIWKASGKQMMREAAYLVSVTL